MKNAKIINRIATKAAAYEYAARIVAGDDKTKGERLTAKAEAMRDLLREIR